MKKKINLNSIIKQFCYITKDGQEDVHSSIESVKNAMKEACKQTLELAAENAKINWVENNIKIESDYDYSFRDNDGNN